MGSTPQTSLLPDAAESRSRPGRLAWGIAAAVTLLAAVVPAVLWPGDAPWTNDEPILIVHAAQANRGLWLVERGLTGSLGLSYSPLPTQIYQALLLLTHDPCRLVALRGLLCAGVTAISLLSLARTLKFSPWFAAAVCLAPDVYLFQRILWDATFVVPIGTLAFAAYARFLQTGSRRSLLLMLAATCTLPLIHPQTLPLSAALIGHLLWRHRGSLWKHRASAAAVGIALAVLNGGYLRYAIATVLTHGGELLRTGQGAKISPLRAACTPLWAGDILCRDPFASGDSRLGALAPVVADARLLALGVHALVWLGIAVTGYRAIGALRRSSVLPRVRRDLSPSPGTPGEGWGEGLCSEAQKGEDPHPALSRSTGRGKNGARAQQNMRGRSPQDNPRDTLLGIALTAFILQMLLYAAVRVPPIVSYFFGLFPIIVLFAWVGIEALRRPWLQGMVIATYGVCVAALTLTGAGQVHRFGWPRGTLSPTLGNQVQVARALNTYSDTRALTNVSVYESYSHALSTLRYLLPPTSGTRQTHSGRLFIRYRTEEGPTDGRIELVEVAPADMPPDAKSLGLSPPR